MWSVVDMEMVHPHNDGATLNSPQYSNHDIWPGDKATVVALYIFLYPRQHNIIRRSVSEIMDLRLTNQIGVFVLVKAPVRVQYFP